MGSCEVRLANPFGDHGVFTSHRVTSQKLNASGFGRLNQSDVDPRDSQT